MIRLLLISTLLLSFNLLSQIDQTQLLVGRTTGTHTLHDGNSTRIFGFAETLGADIYLPGPTIHVTEGDSVEIDFWNVSQGAPHTIHLHGLDVNQENDGVPSLSFDVHHMDHGFYKFKAPHPGTYIYHCHVVSTIHVQAGMYGVIIVTPSNGDNLSTWNGGESFDRDFLWTASEIDTNWHTDAVLDHPHDTINPQPMFVPDNYLPQYFLVNGQSGSQLTDVNNYYTAGVNEKVYMRLVNIGYQGVRYIFPSNVNARTISSDGRPLPTDFINDTVEVLPGERYGTIIQLGSDALYPVEVQHFNLNTQEIESSQDVTIRTSDVSLADEPAIERTLIYPNPSSHGLFFIDAGTSEDYVVYNLLGEKIKSGNSSYLIDLSGEASGTYLLRLKGEYHKLIKN